MALKISHIVIKHCTEQCGLTTERAVEATSIEVHHAKKFTDGTGLISIRPKQRQGIIKDLFPIKLWQPGHPMLLTGPLTESQLD
jgi:hypothetical protein|tara:strand:- start:191 stop:442 length:252 start_codon:yes stop_codon:yes gene_type:complete